MKQFSLRFGLIAFVVGELLHLIEIVRNRIRESAGVLHGKVGIGYAQHYATDRLCQHRVIHEPRIDETAVMLESVVTRVIDAARVSLFVETYVQHRYAKMTDKCGKLRTRTKRLDRKVLVRVRRHLSLGPRVLGGGWCESSYPHFRAQAIADRYASLRIDHVGGDSVYQMLKVVAATYAQEATFVGVRVNV